MDKVYEFNGKKYRLRELDLNLLHDASPLLIKYRELHYRYTCNIDTTTLDTAEYEAEQLKQAINECDSSEIEYLSKLELKLKEAEDVLKSPGLIALKKYISDTEALALFEILTDAVFMKGILNKILIPDSGKEKIDITEDDLRSKDSIGFIKEVIADFFLLTMKNS